MIPKIYIQLKVLRITIRCLQKVTESLKILRFIMRTFNFCKNLVVLSGNLHLDRFNKFLIFKFQ